MSMVMQHISELPTPNATLTFYLLISFYTLFLIFSFNITITISLQLLVSKKKKSLQLQKEKKSKIILVHEDFTCRPKSGIELKRFY